MLQKVRNTFRRSRGAAENERAVESAMFQVKPSKLVVPSEDEPLSMFEAATWGMSFPDLFPYADGLPFLKRDFNMDATELFRYLLLREELQYTDTRVAEMVTVGALYRLCVKVASFCVFL